MRGQVSEVIQRADSGAQVTIDFVNAGDSLAVGTNVEVLPVLDPITHTYAAIEEETDGQKRRRARSYLSQALADAIRDYVAEAGGMPPAALAGTFLDRAMAVVQAEESADDAQPTRDARRPVIQPGDMEA